MSIIAGVDIGNATTEVAIVRKYSSGQIDFLSSSLVETTGIKGTELNVQGVLRALEDALEKAKLRYNDLTLVRINEATPVIADIAMETITETIVTESSMIGHNPSTPSGIGLGTGVTVDFSSIDLVKSGNKIIVIVDDSHSYEEASRIINNASDRGVLVQGVIVQNDDAVLINNRLINVIPIVDEVSHIQEVPRGMHAAVEVAEPGRSIQVLSNPFGIASLFSLGPDETKAIIPVARALIGNRSAVVIKTAVGQIKERRIPAGVLTIIGKRGRIDIDIEEGAERIVEAIENSYPLEDVEGQAGTNVGGMIQRIKLTMAEITNQLPSEIKIKDILPVDTMFQKPVSGSLAGEFASENAVALGAMVKTSHLPMKQIASTLQKKIGIPVEIAGVEAEMAVMGALTTPGTGIPIAVLDLGAGSTDAALLTKNGEFTSIHLAGAGDMVSMLIDSELNLENRAMAEDIKKYPLAKVESLFHRRLEDGTVQFFDKVLDPKLFARTVLLKENDVMEPLVCGEPVERIRQIRRNSKKKIFVTNCLRALKKIAPGGNIRNLDFVVMVGGSALDFEVTEMVSDELSKYGIVAGRGNVRGTEGPRNAVATGLVIANDNAGKRS